MVYKKKYYNINMIESNNSLQLDFSNNFVELDSSNNYDTKFKNLFKTTYGNSIYSNLWYCDSKNKLCITFTPRGGCSISFQQYLDVVGLLDEGLQYNSFIHEYRCLIMDKHIKNEPIKTVIDNKYTIIKFIINPYIRAVSVWRSQISHNLSFREYLKQLINGLTFYFSDIDKYHYQPQYIDGEENVITKYIKIDKNEKFQIELADGTPYVLDLSRYTSVHHGKKTDILSFCGDLPKHEVNENLPKSYKYFYDEEIKKMVETFYELDIKHYGYSFDDF